MTTDTPFTPTITSFGSSTLAAGTSVVDARDEHAAGRRGHLVAERAECDDRRDLLRALHVLGVLPVALRVGRPVGRQCLRRNERRAVGSGEREELLELADAPHEDVDVVDVALGVRPAALDLDLAGKRLGAVGHEEDSRRRGATRAGAPWPRARSDRARRRCRRTASSRHYSPRVRAPSTSTTMPLTYEARSEQRKATTSPTSRVVPSRRSGIDARSSSVGPSG